MILVCDSLSSRFTFLIVYLSPFIVLCPEKTICESVPSDMVVEIDFAVVIYFAVEFGLRVFLCPFAPIRYAGLSSFEIAFSQIFDLR